MCNFKLYSPQILTSQYLKLALLIGDNTLKYPLCSFISRSAESSKRAKKEKEKKEEKVKKEKDAPDDTTPKDTKET